MMYVLGFGMLCAIVAVVWRVLKPKTRVVCRYEVDYVEKVANKRSVRGVARAAALVEAVRACPQLGLAMHRARQAEEQRLLEKSWERGERWQTK